MGARTRSRSLWRRRGAGSFAAALAGPVLSKGKRLFVKLDREPVTHPQHVLVVFATIGDAVFGEQLRINLIPPRLGVGEDAIQVEDHSVERLRHDGPRRQSLVVNCYQLSVDWDRSRDRSE